MTSDAPPIALVWLWLPLDVAPLPAGLLSAGFPPTGLQPTVARTPPTPAESPGAVVRVPAPLSHRGALELLAAVTRGLEPAAPAWRELLWAEPALCAWVVARAGERGVALRRSAIAAVWLATHAPRESFASAAGHAGAASNGVVSADSIAEAHQNECWAKLALLAQTARPPSPAAASLDAPDLCAAHGAWRDFLQALFAARPVASAIGPAPAWLSIEHASVSATREKFTAVVSETAPLPPELADRWLRPGVDASWVPLALERLSRSAVLESDFQRALETEKLDAMKELAYGAGHEINNPLANISARAQTLLREERDPERRRRLAAIHAQAFRAHEMIADMMLFARPPRPEWGDVELGELIGRVVASLAPAVAQRGASLKFAPPAAPCALRADGAQLSLALRALCLNALESLDQQDQGGCVEIAVCELAGDAEVGEAPSVEITVRDTGPGISADVASRIFDPFYSGREAGRGLGMGLSKCWRIVTGHGGRLSASDRGSAEGRSGACFTIRLPRRPDSGSS